VCVLGNTDEKKNEWLRARTALPAFASLLLFLQRYNLCTKDIHPYKENHRISYNTGYFCFTVVYLLKYRFVLSHIYPYVL